MPVVDSEHLGSIEYDLAEVIHFPQGLPAFESEREFLALETPDSAPVVFLQSLATPGLTFLALPSEHVDPGYRLELGEEEATLLPGPLTVLFLVTIGEQRQVTANLLAPVVVDTAARRAAQVVMAGSGYAVQHPLVSPWGPEGAGQPCS